MDDTRRDAEATDRNEWPGFSDAWRAWRAATDLDEYESRWDRLAATGADVHGEAEFVMSLAPTSVVDAGCGMGRVAIELHRRGARVVGIDLDAELLDRARHRAPELTWVRADLATLDVTTVLDAVGVAAGVDVVVMAGNVLPFVAPASRAGAIERCAHLLAPGGRLVTGASLSPGWPTVAELDDWCAGAGLVLDERHAGWDRQPWRGPTSDYAVSVHVLR